MNWADWLNDICILGVMDIHCSYQNLLCWAGIVWHRLSANQIGRYFKLKKLKNCTRYRLDFLPPLKLQKIYILFWVMLENTLGQSVCRSFYFWLIWLVNIGGPLPHCTCWTLLLFLFVFITNHERFFFLKQSGTVTYQISSFWF